MKDTINTNTRKTVNLINRLRRLIEDIVLQPDNSLLKPLSPVNGGWSSCGGVDDGLSQCLRHLFLQEVTAIGLEDLGVGPGDRLELIEGPDGFILRPRRIDLTLRVSAQAVQVVVYFRLN